MIWKKISAYLYCIERQHIKGRHRDMQRKSSHVKTEEEIGMMRLQAKECQDLLSTTRKKDGARKDSSLELSKGG